MVPLKKPKVTVKTYPWWNWASYMFWARSKKWKIGNSNIQKIPIQSYIHNIKRGRVRGKTGRGLTMQKKNKSKCLPNCQSKHFFLVPSKYPNARYAFLAAPTWASRVARLPTCKAGEISTESWLISEGLNICYIYTHTHVCSHVCHMI